jgi:hypothetical protein
VGTAASMVHVDVVHGHGWSMSMLLCCLFPSLSDIVLQLYQF